ncbi:MFS transporter [Streptomyces sp. RFCAC02]|uniref:MFS transporter n=1 Tax=Streptomyces sp. RFCAC02 TaxID=2499143 RepID=UPI001F10E9A3|nr:MFS transporter [Streptomyces sp. RFCAC02]
MPLTPPGRVAAPYRALLRTPGALAFTLPNLMARLPSGMFGVAAVLMITDRHDSYALAGAVQATGLAASVVVGPLIARLVDRRGQSAVLVPAAFLCATGHLALLLAVLLDAPVWMYFCCAVATSAQPNTGGMSRARWAHLYPDDSPDHTSARHTANSLEQAMDELCYMSGPVLAAFLCTALFPEAGTATAAVLLLAGSLLFAAQRGTEPPPAPRSGAGRAPLRTPGMPSLLAVFVCTGAVFGALEVVTIAFADERGQRALAGAVLAAQAAGSAVAGLAFGLLRAAGTPHGRLARCSAAMAVLMCLPLLAARTGSLPALAPALLLAGMATAPTMITGMTLVQTAVPAGRLNEGMTLAVTALLGGIALGSATGGWAAEHLGAPALGYLLPLTAASTAALLALIGSLRAGRRPSPGPAVPAAA